MRGEHDNVVLDGVLKVGIIPACAGSTLYVNLEIQEAEGSSPHARGARAYSRETPRWARDHPRMRGEHSDEKPEY